MQSIELERLSIKEGHGQTYRYFQGQENVDCCLGEMEKRGPDGKTWGHIVEGQDLERDSFNWEAFER